MIASVSLTHSSPLLTSIAKPLSPLPVLILFGPPGAGKGTFSQYIKMHYNYTHLSVGDLVREEIDQQSEIGKEAQDRLGRGEFLKESVIQSLVLKYLTPLITNETPVIIDGFPRTLEAVHFTHDLFHKYKLNKKVLLIIFNADDETCKKRVLTRLICKKCHAIFNEHFNPPKTPLKCDFCSATLQKRSNDSAEIIEKRLADYHQTTKKAYELAKRLFPSKEFDTNRSLPECLNNYLYLFNVS